MSCLEWCWRQCIHQNKDPSDVLPHISILLPWVINQTPATVRAYSTNKLGININNSLRMFPLQISHFPITKICTEIGIWKAVTVCFTWNLLVSSWKKLSSNINCFCIRSTNKTRTQNIQTVHRQSPIRKQACDFNTIFGRISAEPGAYKRLVNISLVTNAASRKVLFLLQWKTWWFLRYACGIIPVLEGSIFRPSK